MARVRIDTRNLERAIHGTKRAFKEAVNDCIDDLVRTSSETAPHDKGILEKSFSKEVYGENTDVITGYVDYSVKEAHGDGTYNYALAMHEKNYQLGSGSRAKPGGTGMSGQHYPVGKKFLTRPLEGEKEAYKDHIEKAIKRELQK